MHQGAPRPLTASRRLRPQAPIFSNMRRRSSRKDSDMNCTVDLRYTGGLTCLLMLELGKKRCMDVSVKIVHWRACRLL